MHLTEAAVTLRCAIHAAGGTVPLCAAPLSPARWSSSAKEPCADLAAMKTAGLVR